MKPTEKFQRLLDQSAARHDHLCPRQILGVRIGLLAGKILQLEVPQPDKRLYAIVETDGCGMDGIAVATGCSPGRRSMHILDYGKMAATFIDTQTGAAIRISPHPQSRQLWQQYAPDAPDRWHGYLEAYRVMPDEKLLIARPIELNFSLEKTISLPDLRAVCAVCDEEIINERQVLVDGQVLCPTCAGESYFTYLETSTDPREARPPCGEHSKFNSPESPRQNRLHETHPNDNRSHDLPVICFVGRSGCGKTTLLEKLIPELKARGYRIGTVKHHAHPGFDIDKPGKDTWRHAQAGSDHVVIAAPDKIASIRKLADRLDLHKIASNFKDVDLVLTEGFSRTQFPKIELLRTGWSAEPLDDLSNRVAWVSDNPDLATDLPVLALDDYQGLADFIEIQYLTTSTNTT
jgi:molybdopterin-guanine dinucleotide biosynthesis protein MobB